MHLSRRRPKAELEKETVFENGVASLSCGKKGGTSANAGRRARILEVSINGKTYTKRVFGLQQYIVVHVKDDMEIVTAHATERQAIQQCDYSQRDGWNASYAEAKNNE